LYQLYWVGTRDAIAERVERARNAGAKALIVTLDWSFAIRKDWETPTIPERVGLKTLLKLIATVGASSDPEKPAGGVPLYLKEIGFRVIPVNPNIEELYGEKAYRSLLEIPEQVDVVQVFRPSTQADTDG
jgi:isopentenyl diphosphate isomerase/L-lactate dehydrogenase-like FMN-dependent dehydrogenase